jgi:16S rRNA (uracil1498-N3)-methyltransferase
MSTERYFVVDPDSEKDGVILLGGAEFHHCVRVCRVHVGDTVKLIDGRGGMFEARVERIEEDRALLRVLFATRALPLPEVDIALSVIKAPRFGVAVEKCTELGVRRIIPVTSERCVWRDDGGNSAKIERIRRKIIASCKQSGRPYFPEIASVTALGGLLEGLGRYGAAYLADRESDSLTTAVGKGCPAPVLGIVGPEGGFTPAERKAILDRRVRAISLGPFRLRSETAAVCLLYRLLIDCLA